MKYLSAKEVAEKWGLNIRTVQNFCACGRISGAKNLGRQWVIPADAIRPSDNRVKACKSSDDTYRFPVFIFSPAYANCDTLNPNEYALFSAQLKHIECDYSGCIGMCREILKQDVPEYIIMGSHFIMSLCAIILGNHYEYKKSMAAMETIVSSAALHLDDYKLIMNSIKYHIGWDHRIFDDIDVAKLSSDALYYYQYECMLSVLLENKAVSDNTLHVYDAVARQISSEGIEPLEVNIRFAQAAFHDSSSNTSGENPIDTACRIAISHNWLELISRNYPLRTALTKEAICRIDKGCYKKVLEISTHNYNNWRMLNRLESGIYPFEAFSPSNISLLFMIYQGLSNNEICTIMNYSPKELQDALRNCYKIADVKNRNELKKYATTQISTWFKS